MFIGNLFTQDANLSFGDVSLANSTIEVILTNDMPVTGFQFEVNTDSLISIESATGGSQQ